MNKRTFSVLSLLVVLTMLLGTPVAMAQGDTPGAAKASQLPHALQGASGPQQVILELTDAPAGQAYADALAGDVQAAAAVQAARTQLSRIQASQQALESALSGLGARVIYRVQKVYNGIAVVVDAGKLDAVAKLPGVKAVHPLVPKTLNNASSVPLINAPRVWAGDAGTPARGEGIKIGIIDTGIDYLHADFGGQGAIDPTLYTRNDRTRVGDIPGFPSAKVVGGYDFAGDAYDAGADPGSPALVPQPDPDPMDCNGHGSHVAGTAAGYGVVTSGQTYTGTYNTSLNFLQTFRIGPGVAPLASLYALRVFGCEGSTNLVAPALEWAADPNGDGDFSDHLDVVNMSLGSPFGVGYDADTVATNIASALGVLVVTSAGNEGDAHYVTGSPGAAERAISVAATVDQLDVMDAIKVEPPSTAAGYYGVSRSVAFNWQAMTTPVSGPLYYPATNRSGCAAFSAAEKANITGKVVILDWTFTPTGGNECGSVARTGNARAAGAKAVILVEPAPLLSISITGDAVIPSVITTQTVGDILKAHIGDTVTFSRDFPKINVLTPGAVDTLASFSSRGPRGTDNLLKPDVAAPGQSIFSAAYGTGNQGESLNGTSMAAPHVTGMMALLRELHANWTNQQLKALAMNTANHDIRSGIPLTSTVYGEARMGAGRVDAFQASEANVIAFSSERPQAVSVSFGAVEVQGITTTVRYIDVQNMSNSAATYDVTFQTTVDEPGVSFTVSPASVTVPANGRASVAVTLNANAANMKHAVDPTFNNKSGQAWLSEESGRVVLTPTGGTPQPLLRVPVYAAARPVSNMHASASTLNFRPGATITLAGTGITGTTLPTDEQSLVMPFQLQTIHATDVTDGRPYNFGAIHYAGVATDYKATHDINKANVYFGLATYGRWATPNNVEFDVNIDTTGDGKADYVLFNWNYGSATGGDPNDIFISALVDLKTNKIKAYDLNVVAADVANTVPYNTDMMILSAAAKDLGLTAANSRLSYWITSFRLDNGDAVDQTAPRLYNVTRPGASFVGGTGEIAPGTGFYRDVPGATIPVDFDMGGWSFYNLGILLLHTHNPAGQHAEVITVTLPFGRIFMPMTPRH